MANTNKNTVTVTMDFSKTTKNAAMFVENVESELSPKQIGMIYIPKTTLAALGYAEGKHIKIDLSVVD